MSIRTGLRLYNRWAKRCRQQSQQRRTRTFEHDARATGQTSLAFNKSNIFTRQWQEPQQRQQQTPVLCQSCALLGDPPLWLSPSHRRRFFMVGFYFETRVDYILCAACSRIAYHQIKSCKFSIPRTSSTRLISHLFSRVGKHLTLTPSPHNYSRVCATGATCRRLSLNSPIDDTVAVIQRHPLELRARFRATRPLEQYSDCGRIYGMRF